MNDLTTFHPLHAAGFGLAGVAAAKALGFENSEAVIAGAVVGGGTYAYMSTYGHALPWTSVSAISSKIPPGGSPATPPTTATNVWSDAQIKAFDSLWKKSAADRRAAAANAASAQKGIPQVFSASPVFSL